MATIYFRKTSKSGTSGLWWVKYYDPITAVPDRISLGTPSAVEAKRILHRLELEIELRRPNLAPLPPSFQKKLGPIPNHCIPVGSIPMEQTQPLATSTTVLSALRSYYTHINADNDSHHIASKLSILRAFFGSSVVEEATGKSCRNITPAYYLSKTLDDLTPVLLQEFVGSRKISDKSKKHYRELFHHFIEKMIDLALFVPSNSLRPNPAAALPSYQPKNDVIIYLKDDDIARQLAALSSHPIIQLAVEIMIYAGLRREEVLGLRTEDIFVEKKLLKVAKYIDPDTQKARRLKTGSRKVPIAPTLLESIKKHLEGHQNYSLLPGWNGKRWTGDNFSKKLAKLNQEAGLSWTCNEFRHTYATRLANEGASLFKIANLMGNGQEIVARHYAQFILSDEP